MIVGMLLRTHFSLIHAQMAAFHAHAALALEMDASEEVAIAMAAHVSSAVVCSGAFIEAAANEITEEDYVKGRGALDRLNDVLIQGGKVSIQDDERVWSNAKLLVELRNRLIHYRHDWLDVGTDNMVGAKALSRTDLQTKLAEEFAFLPASVVYIPRFLSPGCAAWAVQTATGFLDCYHERMGAVAFYDHLRDRIRVDAVM